MKFLIIFISTFLFAFEVEFYDTFIKRIYPNEKAILISPVTDIDYSPKIITKKGVILLNYDEADQFLRNDFYLVDNEKVEDIKIAKFDIDKERINIINKLKQKYKNYKIKQIVFTNNDFQKIYFNPKTLQLKTKIILEGK